MWQLSANYSSERTERCSFFCLTLSSAWGLSQRVCSTVRVWRYIMASLLIRVVSSSMKTWPASNMHLMWITCGLFLFPLMVSDPCERATTGCLFSYTLDVILIPFADLVFWTCFLCERSKSCLPCLVFDLANSCMLLLGWGSVVLQDCCIFTVYLISCWLYSSLSVALCFDETSLETVHSFLPSSLVQSLIMRAVFSQVSRGSLAE